VTAPCDPVLTTALGLALLLFCCLALFQRRTMARLEGEIAALRASPQGEGRVEGEGAVKARFLATVSHEIRTPLNGVMGLAQLLDMTRLDAEQASYVEAMTESGRALAQLIDDILDFSQIESGALRMRRETFVLAPLVDGVLELLAPRAMSKGLEIAAFISPLAPHELTGDPARLRQALINLLGNAVNYTEKGGVCLRVHVDGAALRFDVQDSGPGVPVAAREAIFEAFERADTETTRRQAGAGLGLSISRRLVGLMGGTLTLAETSPEGSTFSILLPLCASSPGPVARPLAGLRVAIVSDSRFAAPCLAESLTAVGATATILAGAAHVAQAGLADMDAVILDCALGPQAVHRLAKDARTGGARRLFLLFSPLERRAFGERALSDVDGWLVKPVRRSSLLARLAQFPSQAPTVAAAQKSLEPELSFASISEGEAFPSLSRMNVLLAEDNDVNALIVARALEKLGARVTRASDGAEAVAMAAGELGSDLATFDVILMDLFLPECDGGEAIRQIRAAEGRAGAQRMPIVVLTASVLEEDACAARAAGADAQLTKPVDLAVLATTLAVLRPTPASLPAAYAPPGGMVPNLPER
jgi:signal transduction histidine kinase/CheY-like chemotaxis protein